MDTDAEQSANRAEIRGYVWRWQYALGQQAERTLRPAENVDHEIDAHFFAIALKNLRAAVGWGRDYCNGQRDGQRGKALNLALVAFDSAVPHVGDVRDVQEHFVAYAQGKGNLQTIPEPLAIWWETTTDTVVVNVLGMRLDIATATEAGHALAGAGMEALVD